MFEFWLMVFIIIEINILKQLGIAEKSVTETENIYQTFLRVGLKPIFKFFNIIKI